MALEASHEEQGIGWGSAQPAPSVQEILRNNPLCVPDRYRRGRQEKSTADVVAASLDLPVIDLSLLSSGDEGERLCLDSACKDWGFFQTVNHGISDEVIRSGLYKSVQHRPHRPRRYKTARFLDVAKSIKKGSLKDIMWTG
ncbi:unnamed protein product [Spirodela intermedia]|uniref:Non-haem dioxygenase N-terminal domain-containing protein n=1 Tax=Spirodela intermedia TaxID=51605 RepID=A0A7I8K0L2_SPIIN|nr:unnamed protein product [Spirodela intermedia]